MSLLNGVISPFILFRAYLNRLESNKENKKRSITQLISSTNQVKQLDIIKMLQYKQYFICSLLSQRYIHYYKTFNQLISTDIIDIFHKMAQK